jgi:hypothetical protein
MLFRHGPLALGFWKGLSDADICARIARNSEAQDWMVVSPASHPTTSSTATASTACLNMIDREFRSFAVVVHTVLYLVCVLVLLSSVRQYWAARVKARAQTQAFSKAIQHLHSAHPGLNVAAASGLLGLPPCGMTTHGATAAAPHAAFDFSALHPPKQDPHASIPFSHPHPPYFTAKQDFQNREVHAAGPRPRIAAK